MTGALYLTDGTTRINLYTGIDGFNLDRWEPSIAPAKDTWRESPLSDGRKLAMSKWANAIETMSFVVSRFTQDDVIADTQELRRLLEQAKQYFIGGSDAPVWLEARGTCETNTRYATICNYLTSNDSDPYHKPFDLDHPAMSPWTLVLERQHWRDTAPGSSTCVQLSATQDYYDASDDDFVPTESADDCYVNTTLATIYLNIAAIYFGRIAGNIFGNGMRFRNVVIPNGAIILQAYIRFEADFSDATDDVKVTLSADDTDDAAIFSTFANFTGRPRTAAHIHWTIPHWVAGTFYLSPEFKTVVQAIVSRPGWLSGNDLAVLVDDDGSTINAVRYAVSWDHAAVRYEPHLFVWWYDTLTRTFGRTATCNNEVYIANKHNLAQLTHCFRYTAAGGGAYSGNLIGLALPTTLLPAVPAAGDMVYFGNCTAAGIRGPFCSLVFDIGTAQVDLTTILWEFWNGAAWGVLTVRDNTDTDGFMVGAAFDTAGVNSVHWMQPVNWATTAVNGITGYWVRARVTVVGGAPAAPTQQNRDIYTVVTPYIDTVAAQVPGDIPALARLLLEGQSGDAGTLDGPQRLLMGLRSYDRGADFTAYLNFGAQNMPSYNSTDNTTGAGTCLNTVDLRTPTGRMYNWITGGAAAETWLGYITIGQTYTSQFAGTFRVKLRIKDNGAFSQRGQFRLSICSNVRTNVVWRSKLVVPPNIINYPLAIDFGLITLPSQPFDAGKIYDYLLLRIDGIASAAVDYELWDLVIVPADECFIEANAIPQADTGLYYNSLTVLDNASSFFKCLDADSLYPRRQILTEVYNWRTGIVVATWQPHISGSLTWQPNEHQRWWIFQDRGYASNNFWLAEHEMTLSAQGWRASRYLSMRGAR